MSLQTQIQLLSTGIGTEIKTDRVAMYGTSTGDLSGLSTTDKSSLIAAINEVATAASSISTTDDLSEGGTNLYFTDARVLASTLTGFVSGAGAVSASDSVLGSIQKLDGNVAALEASVAALSTTDVSEGTNLYFTDARADARVQAAIGSSATPSTTELASTQDLVDYAQGVKDSILDGAGAAYDTLIEISNEIQSNDADLAALLGGVVRIDIAQTLTTAQQTQAHSNLNVVSATDIGDTSTDFVAVFQAALT